MAFNIVRKDNEGVQIGEGITVRMLNSNVCNGASLLSIDAPYGVTIERLENVEAGLTTAVKQRKVEMTSEQVLSFVKEAEQVCDTKERQRLMIRGLPTFAGLSDEAIDAFVMAVQN